MSDTENPFEIFATIYAEVLASAVPEPSAFCLATVDAQGRPSARMLLLKGVDSRGFAFYTNLNSRKAGELVSNPNAAMCFYWPHLGRQVRVEGAVERVSDAEADAYFRTRARGSQIGAWASQQSSELADRGELIARIEEIERRYDGLEVPRPPHWSGFLLVPRRIEFWSAGEFRLHDRLVFERAGDDAWRTQRLYP